MYLVQQGSGLATAEHINWVLNHFLAKILQFEGWKSDKPLQFVNCLPWKQCSQQHIFLQKAFDYLLQTDMIYFTNQCFNLFLDKFSKWDDNFNLRKLLT